MLRRENENSPDLDSPSLQSNLLAAGQSVSPQVVDRAMARGRRLRSEALLHLLTALVRGICQLLQHARRVYRCRRDARRSEQALRALGGQLRRDIGIDGHQIPVLARCPEKEAEGVRDGRAQLNKSPAMKLTRSVSDDGCVGCAA